MFRRSIAALLSMMLFTQLAFAQMIVDFDELSEYSHASAAGSYFDGNGGDATLGEWSSQGATFNTGFYGPGWSYSNVDDTTTRGFTNPFAAITGTDHSGNGNANYVTGYYSDFAFFQTGAEPIINLPVHRAPESVYVTNTTYAYWSMREGDGPGGFAKKFGGDSGTDPDYFKATFTGFDDFDGTGSETGSVPFYLADFRSSDSLDDYIVDTWEFVDLTGLGKAKSIRLNFETTDMGDFGPNTPTYIAIDSLAITNAPEPSTFTLLGFVSAAAAMMHRRRRVTS